MSPYSLTPKSSFLWGKSFAVDYLFVEDCIIFRAVTEVFDFVQNFAITYYIRNKRSRILKYCDEVDIPGATFLNEIRNSTIWLDIFIASTIESLLWKY